MSIDNDRDGEWL